MADTYEPNTLQAVQLEDGSTAYIHHAVQMSQPNTILAIQTNGTVADLHTDATIDQETINALEQYTTKVQPRWLGLMQRYSMYCSDFAGNIKLGSIVVYHML